MNILKEIHWHEGLFLRPHHLQLFQREINKGLIHNRSTSIGFPYGFIKSSINEIKLEEEGVLEFTDLEALMPSGNYIDTKANCYIPPITINNYSGGEIHDEIILLLGLPFYNAAKANLSSKDEIKNDKISRLYSVNEIESHDENTGGNTSNILVRRFNPRIFFEGESYSDYEMIPAVRIKRAGQGKFKLDKEFSPPCFKISGCDNLNQLILKTISYLNETAINYRFKLSKLCAYLENMHKLTIPLQKLRIITTYSFELKELSENTNPAPHGLYVIMRKLLFEICSLVLSINPYEVSSYNHNNPYPTFKDLEDKLVKALEVELILEKYLKFKFSKVENENCYNLSISTEHFSQNAEYYLALKSKIPHADLVNNIEKGISFKLLPSDLVSKMAIPGFDLYYMSTLPRELFRDENEYFFKIAATNDMWKDVTDRGNLSVMETISSDHASIDEINLVILKNRST